MTTRPRIHHLDCGTMCPRAAPALGLTDRAHPHLVARCLLVEAPDGLVLIDTGFGSGDVADPRRLGPARLPLAARLDPAQTAAAQVVALGHEVGDVRHVLVTHLDLDHAGGLGDVPGASVHVHSTELAAARARKGKDGLRYREAHWAHGPRWEEHTPTGERWFGFEGARLLEGFGVEIVMLPLAGHTHGHTGYAVRDGDRWLLHAGDTYLHHGEIATPPTTSRALRAYHRLNSVDEPTRRHNVARLAELARDRADDVTVFCSHDATEFAQAHAH